MYIKTKKHSCPANQCCFFKQSRMNVVEVKVHAENVDEI